MYYLVRASTTDQGVFEFPLKSDKLESLRWKLADGKCSLYISITDNEVQIFSIELFSPYIDRFYNFVDRTPEEIAMELQRIYVDRILLEEKLKSGATEYGFCEKWWKRK